jgi:hypothetical protein
LLAAPGRWWFSDQIVPRGESFFVKLKARVLGVIAVGTATTVLMLTLQTVAGALPRGPKFGPFIEALPEYQAQSTCSPDPKPGVLAFEDRVLAAYPKTTSLGISRDCSIGGTSEHKEGRAWDWGVRIDHPAEKADAEEVISWLLKDDRYGNAHAMARRVGIMYLIWNRRIWTPWSGWRTYCVQKKAGCVSPGTTNDVRDPHTGHVHFSFSWDGAWQRDTFWHPSQSLVADIDASASDPSFWSAGGNGGASSSAGVAPYGVKGRGFLKNPVVDIATTSTGAGYWLLSQNGQVNAFGDAPRKGRVRTKPFTGASIAGTSTAKGYWVLGNRGRVFPFGDAIWHGDLTGSDERFAAITPTPTNKGYWLLSTSGEVTPFGDATDLGSATIDLGSAVALDATPTGLGYWVATDDGGVQAFGDARSYGDLAGQEIPAPIVSMSSTRSGRGYWLVSSVGRIAKFGNAQKTDARQVVPPPDTSSAFTPRVSSAREALPGD